MNAKDKKREKLFVKLYDTYVDSIFRFCYFKTGNKETAKDLTQDIFIKVFNRFVKIEEEIQNHKSFIYTVAKNTIIDFWRKSKSVTENQLPEGFFESIIEEDRTETMLDYSIFLSLLNKLSEADREVILLRYVDDMSSKDMASLLNERENTILVRISRAKEKLRDLLKTTENNNGKRI